MEKWCISKLKNTLTVSFASHLHSTHIYAYEVNKIMVFLAANISVIGITVICPPWFYSTAVICNSCPCIPSCPAGLTKIYRLQSEQLHIIHNHNLVINICSVLLLNRPQNQLVTAATVLCTNIDTKVYSKLYYNSN